VSLGPSFERSPYAYPGDYRLYLAAVHSDKATAPLMGRVHGASGFLSLEGPVDAGVVDLRATSAVLLDLQRFPLPAQARHTQNVVEDLVKA